MAGKRRKEKTAEQRIGECARRISSPKERRWFRQVLQDLVRGNVAPLELLEQVPMPAREVGKTRFDQIYDACAFLAFPGYRTETLERLLGPTAESRQGIKIWRAMFPSRFKVAHVLLRADSFQQAFALACDYACRVSLRSEGRIPSDLTVRIQFVSEKAIRRMLDMRWANRVKKRKQLQLVGRQYTPKELAGARLVALGDPDSSSYRIFRYAEKKDLLAVLSKKGRVRESAVETETRVRRRPASRVL